MLHTLFGLSGRISRKAFWLTQLALYAILYGLVILMAAMPGVQLFAIAFLVILLPFIYATSVAIPIKRLHDRDRSGWWSIFFWGSPLVTLGFGVLIYLTGGAEMIDPTLTPEQIGQVMQAYTETGIGRIVFWSYIAFILTASIVLLWLFVELGFFKGTNGPNRFGEDPLAE